MHDMKDFKGHSDVGEFQLKNIKQLVRSFGGEVQKGSAYTPKTSALWNAAGGRSRIWLFKQNYIKRLEITA